MQSSHTPHSVSHASNNAAHGSLKSYLTGFVLSIILTVIPFAMVMNGGYSRSCILAAIVAFAVIQILVHLVYFLHMSTKPEERWNLVSFVFTVVILALLVGGTVWVMAHLSANLMPAATTIAAPGA